STTFCLTQNDRHRLIRGVIIDLDGGACSGGEGPRRGAVLSGGCEEFDADADLLVVGMRHENEGIEAGVRRALRQIPIGGISRGGLRLFREVKAERHGRSEDLRLAAKTENCAARLAVPLNVLCLDGCNSLGRLPTQLRRVNDASV